MIIINNDDFGASKEINRATYLAFKHKLISSTTALVNFPQGLEDAVSYVKSGKINPKAIGIHLNLTEGEPLTARIKKNPTLCSKGSFKPKNSIPDFWLDRSSNECIYDEINAQIQLFKEKFGFLPSHIDSHHHVHTKWTVLRNVVKLAKLYKIPSIRIARNIKPTQSLPKRLYKTVMNKYLGTKGFRVTHLFGDLDEASFAGIDYSKNYEIMVHVQFSDEHDVLVDYDKAALSDKISGLFNGRACEISNFSEL